MIQHVPTKWRFDLAVIHMRLKDCSIKCIKYNILRDNVTMLKQGEDDRIYNIGHLIVEP